ncbi:MAG: hypothetical protein ACXWLH_04820 [Candidatus Saccharimonadales bacterium]
MRSRKHPTTEALEYSQMIWVYKSGSKFPVEFEIRLPNGVQFYQEGDYVMYLDTNLSPDKYKGLSFAPFSTTSLRSVTPAFIESFDKLTQQIDEQLNKTPLNKVA